MATESKTLVILALVANGVTAIVKFIAAAISGSSAMLSEGFHSFADMGNQAAVVIDRVEAAIMEEVREAARFFIELEPGL